MQTFSPIRKIVFLTFLMVPTEVQTLLIYMMFSLSTFSLVAYALSVTSKKPLPYLISWGFMPIFTSKFYCFYLLHFSSVQSLSRVRLFVICDPMNCSTPSLPVHHQLPELAQAHVHRVSDAIQPSHPLSSPSPLAFNLSQHQGLFQRVRSSHQVAKVFELQLQWRLIWYKKIESGWPRSWFTNVFL